MANTPKPPAHESESGDTALEKLKDLARRIVSVPKKEVDKVQKDYDDKPKGPRPHPA